jgi:hypothetical protein
MIEKKSFPWNVSDKIRYESSNLAILGVDVLFNGYNRKICSIGNGGEKNCFYAHDSFSFQFTVEKVK